jgi:hypothetical protein
MHCQCQSFTYAFLGQKISGTWESHRLCCISCDLGCILPFSGPGTVHISYGWMCSTEIAHEDQKTFQPVFWDFRSQLTPRPGSRNIRSDNWTKECHCYIFLNYHYLYHWDRLRCQVACSTKQISRNSAIP